MRQAVAPELAMGMGVGGASQQVYEEDDFQIEVRRVSGGQAWIQLGATTSEGTIVREVAAAFGIPSNQAAVLLDGRVLTKESIAEGLMIERGTVLHVQERMSGGNEYIVQVGLRRLRVPMESGSDVRDLKEVIRDQVGIDEGAMKFEADGIAIGEDVVLSELSRQQQDTMKMSIKSGHGYDEQGRKKETFSFVSSNPNAARGTFRHFTALPIDLWAVQDTKLDEIWQDKMRNDMKEIGKDHNTMLMVAAFARTGWKKKGDEGVARRMAEAKTAGGWQLGDGQSWTDEEVEAMRRANDEEKKEQQEERRKEKKAAKAKGKAKAKEKKGRRKRKGVRLEKMKAGVCVKRWRVSRLAKKGKDEGKYHSGGGSLPSEVQDPE